MVTAYRIFKSKHAARWFDGEGAFLFGGRWNSPGTRLLYASPSLSLAALEMLVNLNADGLLSAYAYATLEFENDLIMPVHEFRKLPNDWAASPATGATQAIGDEWAATMLSAILQVPSAVLPVESNFILNVDHPDFSKVSVGTVKVFEFDPRLQRS
jgi:RES domain-containing protein